MKLYLTPARLLLAVDIVARELDIPLALEWVDVRAKKLRDGSDYYKVNPKGQVPTPQLDDGEFLTEGPVIVQYLADGKPGNGLLPAPGAMGSLPRPRMAELRGHRAAQGLHAAVPSRPRRRNIARSRGRISRRASSGSTVFSLGSRFLTGAAFTVADAYCYTILMWSKLHDIDLAPWPNLGGLRRPRGRPPVRQGRRGGRAPSKAS